MNKIQIFSSPESRLICELIVKQSFTISKIFSSETAGPIKAKLHVGHR